jgi:hypothetical protein
MKKTTDDFTVLVDDINGVCPAGEAWAEKQVLQKKIPVMACESACIRGDIARRVANLLGKEELFGRACYAEALFVPHSSMACWLKEADKVVMVNGCFMKCMGRILNNFVDREKILHFDALQHYEKYCDVFYMEDVSAVERISTTRDVANQILPTLIDSLNQADRLNPVIAG